MVKNDTSKKEALLKPSDAKIEQAEQTEAVTLEWTKADLLWLVLSVLFCGLSLIIFREISETRVLMMDPSRFEPRWFKNSNGETLQT